MIKMTSWHNSARNVEHIKSRGGTSFRTPAGTLLETTSIARTAIRTPAGSWFKRWNPEPTLLAPVPPFQRSAGRGSNGDSNTFEPTLNQATKQQYIWRLVPTNTRKKIYFLTEWKWHGSPHPPSVLKRGGQHRAYIGVPQTSNYGHAHPCTT